MFDQLVLTQLVAMLGAVLAVAAVASRPVRAWLSARLQMPEPSTHNVLAPLDGLRGLAALWIALFHTWQWTQPYFDSAVGKFPLIAAGNAALPIFVILSGFLIWRSARRIRTSDDLARYTRNRFLRIFPAYAAAVLVVFLFGEFGKQIHPVQNLISDLFMARSFGSRYFMLPQTWSLYIEVLFYLAAPVLAVAFGKRPILSATLCLILFSLCEYPGVSREFILWKFFFFGILTSELFDRYQVRIGALSGLLMFVAGISLLFVDLFVVDWFGYIEYGIGLNPSMDPRYRFGLGLGFALFLLSALTLRPLSLALSIRPLRILGTVSYGIFIWHGVFLLADFPISFDTAGDWVKTGLVPWPYPEPWIFYVVVIPAYITAGIASYILIERPCLALRQRRAKSEALHRMAASD
jgi:peptidoglycan/LPS O-acetylase OafA/YrhL